MPRKGYIAFVGAASCFALPLAAVSGPPMAKTVQQDCLATGGTWQDVPEYCKGNRDGWDEALTQKCFSLIQYQGACACPEGTVFSLGTDAIAPGESAPQPAGCIDEN